MDERYIFFKQLYIFKIKTLRVSFSDRPGKSLCYSDLIFWAPRSHFLAQFFPIEEDRCNRKNSIPTGNKAFIFI